MPCWTSQLGLWMFIVCFHHGKLSAVWIRLCMMKRGTSDAIVMVKVVSWGLYMVKVHWKWREKRKEKVEMGKMKAIQIKGNVELRYLAGKEGLTVGVCRQWTSFPYSAYHLLTVLSISKATMTRDKMKWTTDGCLLYLTFGTPVLLINVKVWRLFHFWVSSQEMKRI